MSTGTETLAKVHRSHTHGDYAPSERYPQTYTGSPMDYAEQEEPTTEGMEQVKYYAPSRTYHS